MEQLFECVFDEVYTYIKQNLNPKMEVLECNVIKQVNARSNLSPLLVTCALKHEHKRSLFWEAIDVDLAQECKGFNPLFCTIKAGEDHDLHSLIALIRYIGHREKINAFEFIYGDDCTFVNPLHISNYSLSIKIPLQRNSR